MAEVIEIDINAKDNTSGAANSARANFQRLGRELTGIGRTMTNIFTRPIMDLERLVMKNKEVQEAMKPINEAFSKVGDQLATSFVPIIERLTPALLSLADSLSKIIDGFSKLPPGVQDAIVGFTGLLAALGPVLTVVGQLMASGALPAIGGALAAISAPAWLLIGAFVLLGATIAIFGKQAWQTVTDIGKIFQALWTLIQIKIDQIKQAFLNVDWGGIGRNIITGVINGIRSISVFGAISNAVNVLRRASGGFASGLTLVGERGPELVNLPHGSYVNSNSASQRMAKGGGDFIYAPMFSMGNRSEVENTIAPMVKNIMRGR
jgi:phage-related tail protein